MRFTLNDIAQRAKVSTVTVHKALHGKPGVSEETRMRILEIVKDMDYSINPMASSLKRDILKIVIIYPELAPEKNFFFNQIREGIDVAETKLSDFNVSLIRYPSGDSWEEQSAILESLTQKEKIDGVVIYCLNDRTLSANFEDLEKKGIPVVTFHSDAIDSCRVASVTADDELTGRLAGEFIGQLIPDTGHVILLSGNTMQKVLRDNAYGFHCFLHASRPDLKIIEIDDFQSKDSLSDTLMKLIQVFPDVKGVYCTNARNSISLCRILEEQSISGLKIITSDVFPELKPYMEKGIINGTIWQDPWHQAYDALMLMFDYLTVRPFVKGTVSHVKTSIVLKNNFDQFLS